MVMGLWRFHYLSVTQQDFHLYDAWKKTTKGNKMSEQLIHYNYTGRQ